MKRLISLILSLLLALGACVPAFAQEATYPTKWDLTTLYASLDDWNADYEKALSLVPEAEKFRGTLNTAENIRACYDWHYDSEAYLLRDKVATYAYLYNYLHEGDAQAKDMMAKVRKLDSEIERVTAFIWEEMASLPMDVRQQMMADPKLEPVYYALEPLLDEDLSFNSEQERLTYDLLAPAMWRSYDTFRKLLDAIGSPTITMPDGTEAVLDNETYNKIMSSSEYDYEFKAACLDAENKRVEPYLEVFARLLNTQMLDYYGLAKLNKFATSREQAMELTDVAPEVYDMLVEAAHKGLPEVHRYLEAHRAALGVEKMAALYMNQDATDYEPAPLTFEETVSVVREALSVLGEEYITNLDDLLETGHVDVYPAENKQKGTTVLFSSHEAGPYVMMNYSDSYYPAYVADRFGIALHCMLSIEGERTSQWTPSGFMRAVSGAVNNMLVYRYQLDNAATDEERGYYLRKLLNSFRSDFFEGMHDAELEDELYKLVESGKELEVETLNTLCLDLMKQYRGENVEVLPSAQYSWALSGFFYDSYTAWEDAAAICYAASICQSILTGEEGAADRYITMLSAGASDSPVDLLTTAGVNPLDPQTYDNALAFFSDLVDEYEALTK